MKTFFKRLLAVIGVLVALTAAVSIYWLNRGGAFREMEPQFAGTCESLPMAGSAEDITVDQERGMAYISFMDRQALIAGKDVEGTILRLDLNTRPLKPEPALESAPSPFRTHGLSLHIDYQGRRHLFVINHPKKRGEEMEQVELFSETADGKFAHVETFRSPLFNSPNDLAAVGPRQFYVANDKVSGGGLAAGLQQLGIGGSPLTYFDDREARVVVGNIASGGGINVSADRKTIYVSETSAQRVRVLSRNPADGSLTETARISVPMSPDNIEVAPDASLSIAGHANTLKLIQHFIKGAPAPSSVIRVIADNGELPPAVDQVYHNGGEQISASSVGAVYGDLLLIGSITSPQLLVCEFS